MEQGCRKEGVSPLTEKKKIVDTVTQSQRSNHGEQLDSILLSPGGCIPENRRQSVGYSPWHSQAYQCYGSTVFRAWRESEATTIKCKKATMATTQLSKFSESLGYTPFEIQPVLPFLWRACLRHRQRHLRCVQAALLLRQRRASSWTLSVISFHQFTI